MSRIPILFCGLVAGALVWVASLGLARADQDDDQRLARQLLTAAETYAELLEVTVKHGQRAEIALTILQKDQERANMNARIRDMNSMIADFPQNRRWWIMEQDFFFKQKLALDRELTDLDRQLNNLKFQERQMFEEELQQAQANGKAVKPFNREAILNDLQRLNRESNKAVDELKSSIETAAREQHTTPGQVLDKAKRDLARLAIPTPPPDAASEFLKRFITQAGGKHG